MPGKTGATCYSCGRKADYSECVTRCAPPQDARCKALKGWVTVSRWQGMGAFEQYDFCCLSCLLRWVKTQVPGIPGAFLDAFPDEQK